MRSHLLIYAFAIALLYFSLPQTVRAQDHGSPEIGLVGGDFGIDGRRCETTKAEFDAIAQVANERESNVIIIARLGAGERMRSLNLLRLGKVRDWLLIVRGYSQDRIVIAEGERVSGLGQVEVYIRGKLFIAYRMRRNKEFFKGGGC
jgi:hypothetical protein